MIVTRETIDALDGLLEEHLETDIIARLADRLDLPVREAMDRYYSSDLARQVSEGAFGIQFLDASVLVEDLVEHELSDAD